MSNFAGYLTDGLHLVLIGSGRGMEAAAEWLEKQDGVMGVPLGFFLRFGHDKHPHRIYREIEALKKRAGGSCWIFTLSTVAIDFLADALAKDGPRIFVWTGEQIRPLSDEERRAIANIFATVTPTPTLSSILLRAKIWKED